MHLDLSGRAVIVTGAASGVGAAIAAAAAAAGADLLLTDRDAAGLAATGTSLAAATLVADLIDPAAPAAIAAAALRAFGRIDGLVNAAGLTTRAGWPDSTPAAWDSLFAVNARAPFFLMQAAIADMMARQAPGSIVNILSWNAHCGAPDLAIYAATKGALQTLTKNAAHAHLAKDIRANGINLGWTLTPAEDALQRRAMGPDWALAAAASRPLGRLILPEDCARLALWLLSPASAPQTGTITDLEQAVVGGPP